MPEEANRALLEAIEARDIAAVRSALENGADPNTHNRIGQTAFLRATSTGQKEIAVLLYQIGGIMASNWKHTSEDHDWYCSCTSGETAHALVEAGVDPCVFGSSFPGAVGADRIPRRRVTQSEFQRHSHPRAGISNPEEHLPAFWSEQIRTGRAGGTDLERVTGPTGSTRSPVWSFHRFGRTATRLVDRSWLLIAGEHEDRYDDDFAIYADATVISPEGHVRHFIYPEDVFPPTDFHTATRIGDTLWLIGSLGYPDRRGDRCQVLSMDLDTFAVTRHTAAGEDPGWIHDHQATLDGRRIAVTGGKVGRGYRDRTETHILDTETLVWSRP